MVRHWISEIKAAEPAVGKVQMNLFTKPPFRADTKAISNQKHTDQKFWINRRPARMAVKLCKMCPNAAQIHKSVNRAQQVILGHVIIE